MPEFQVRSYVRNGRRVSGYRRRKKNKTPVLGINIPVHRAAHAIGALTGPLRELNKELDFIKDDSWAAPFKMTPQEFAKTFDREMDWARRVVSGQGGITPIGSSRITWRGSA